MPTLTCSCQGVRNVSFSENFAYVVNEWSLVTEIYHKTEFNLEVYLGSILSNIDGRVEFCTKIIKDF